MQTDHPELPKLLWQVMKDELCANKKTGVRVAMVHEHDIRKVLKKLNEKLETKTVNPLTQI